MSQQGEHAGTPLRLAFHQLRSCSSRRFFLSAIVATAVFAGLQFLSWTMPAPPRERTNGAITSGSVGGLEPPARVPVSHLQPLGSSIDDRFTAMKTNNYSDSLCSAEKYSSDKHVEKMRVMFAFLDAHKLPYWHERGLARIASRFGAGLIEVKPGLVLNPDSDFDLLMLVRNESHWMTTAQHMKKHCPEQLYCVVKVQWNIPRLYIWQVGMPVKYANIMPVYHRNATHGQKHPFHKQIVGDWKRLDDIFPLKKAKLWMYELPVARESWDNCEDGLNATRVFATHQLETAEEQQRAREMMYSCAQNLTAKGFASYFHCFDEHGVYNGHSWKARPTLL